MALDGFASGESENSTTETKTKYFQFQNPDHPNSKDFDNPEQARRHYEAARFIQDQMGADRHNLVGEFLVGVYQALDEEDPDHLQTVVEEILE